MMDVRDVDYRMLDVLLDLLPENKLSGPVVGIAESVRNGRHPDTLSMKQWNAVRTTVEASLRGCECSVCRQPISYTDWAAWRQSATCSAHGPEARPER